MSEPGLKPNSDSKSLSLKYYTLLPPRKVIQTHTSSQNILDSEVIFKTQTPPGNFSHLFKFLAQLIYNPLWVFLTHFLTFKVCHSPPRWQAEGWWWECGNKKFINRRGCQEWTGSSSQRRIWEGSSPSCFSICANQQCVCTPMQTWSRFFRRKEH